MTQSQPTVTKAEALKLLSAQMRKRGIKSLEYCKLFALYSKLSGWDKKGEDTRNPDGEEVSLDKLVAALEKKRKQNG